METECTRGPNGQGNCLVKSHSPVLDGAIIICIFKSVCPRPQDSATIIFGGFCNLILTQSVKHTKPPEARFPVHQNSLSIDESLTLKILSRILTSLTKELCLLTNEAGNIMIFPLLHNVQERREI